MLQSKMLAYFEGVTDGRIFGWARNTSGEPVPVSVRINSVLAAATPKRSWLWRRLREASAGGRFEFRLRLNPGDRVEVFDSLTDRALPGGVRVVVDPRWRPRIALVTPVKQEASYLLEWIAYHRALGIETFLIGDNGGTDGTIELLETLEAAEVIERLDWRGDKAFQTRFDEDAIPRMCGRVDVCSLTDVDEFIRPLNGRTDIGTAIAEIFARSGTSALGVSWATYGSSGRDTPGEGLVVERFTRRAVDDHIHHRTVKTILRPECFAGMVNPHAVLLTGGNYVNDRCDPIAWGSVVGGTKSVSWNSLRIDHFAVKSRSEFDAKARRGRPDLPDGVQDRDGTFFSSRDRNEVVDPMPAEFINRTKDEMAQLRERLKRHISSDSPLHAFL
jgi:hypothetical protein